MPQIKIGGIALGRQQTRPLIVVPVIEVDNLDNLRGADIAELRIDMFISQLVQHVMMGFETFKKKFPGVPVIATCRSKEEGGAAAIAGEDRVAIFTHIIDLTDAVDIEIKSDIALKIADLANQHDKTIIASYHNFSKTPDDKYLEAVYERGKQTGAHIVKVAVTPNGMDDIRRLTEFQLSHESVVTISMGAMGMASRIFLPLVGSLFTFASLETVTAPGQLSIDEVRRYYQAF
ncbi:MAG: type I 3-dehydroquinate dehydratase [Nitrospirae bacterium]|nr:type I 3-dehydroquinate dehydratase [Nitrospirota bacterium]